MFLYAKYTPLRTCSLPQSAFNYWISSHRRFVEFQPNQPIEAFDEFDGIITKWYKGDVLYLFIKERICILTKRYKGDLFYAVIASSATSPSVCWEKKSSAVTPPDGRHLVDMLGGWCIYQHYVAQCCNYQHDTTISGVIVSIMRLNGVFIKIMWLRGASISMLILMMRQGLSQGSPPPHRGQVL